MKQAQSSQGETAELFRPGPIRSFILILINIVFKGMEKSLLGLSYGLYFLEFCSWKRRIHTKTSNEPAPVYEPAIPVIMLVATVKMYYWLLRFTLSAMSAIAQTSINIVRCSTKAFRKVSTFINRCRVAIAGQCNQVGLSRVLHATGKSISRLNQEWSLLSIMLSDVAVLHFLQIVINRMILQHTFNALSVIAKGIFQAYQVGHAISALLIWPLYSAGMFVWVMNTLIANVIWTVRLLARGVGFFWWSYSNAVLVQNAVRDPPISPAMACFVLAIAGSVGLVLLHRAVHRACARNGIAVGSTFTKDTDDKVEGYSAWDDTAASSTITNNTISKTEDDTWYIALESSMEDAKMASPVLTLRVPFKRVND